MHPQPALLRGVDEEEAAEGPPGLAAEGRLGLLVEQDHPLAGVGQLGGGDQPGQPRTHDDDVRFGAALGAHAADASGTRRGAVPARAVPPAERRARPAPHPLADRPPQREGHAASPAARRRAAGRQPTSAGGRRARPRRSTSTASATSSARRPRPRARPSPSAGPAAPAHEPAAAADREQQARTTRTRSSRQAPAPRTRQTR